MAIERFNLSLQESLITLLTHNDESGRLVFHMVEPALFDGDYRVIAERACDYWRRYKQAPKEHAPDLVGDILSDKHNSRAGTFRRILLAMHETAPTLNATYVIDQCQKFMRLQKMKQVILTSAERLNSRQELAIAEIEDMWNEILRVREFAFNPGVRLDDIEKVLKALEQLETEFKLGIKQFDVRRIGPMRGTVLLLLGGSGAGKSWGVIHAGKNAVMQRKKVCHISLEMSEEQVLQRYYQSMFSIPKRETDQLTGEEISIAVTHLKVSSRGQLEDITSEDITPEFALDSDELRMELETRVMHIGSKLNNLMIKRFPTRGLTMNGLRAYLDNLETVEQFVPDVLILDAPYLMKLDADNYRIAVGRAYEEFRGLCIERNMAGIATHQLSRAGSIAKFAGKEHIAEDWSLVQTSDVIIVYSCTDAEAQHGLARLYVAKARDERDKFGVLITQNYDIGQFAMQSVMLTDKYWSLIKDHGIDDEDDAELADEED